MTLKELKAICKRFPVMTHKPIAELDATEIRYAKQTAWQVPSAFFLRRSKYSVATN